MHSVFVQAESDLRPCSSRSAAIFTSARRRVSWYSTRAPGPHTARTDHLGTLIGRIEGFPSTPLLILVSSPKNALTEAPITVRPPSKPPRNLDVGAVFNRVTVTWVDRALL